MLLCINNYLLRQYANIIMILTRYYPQVAIYSIWKCQILHYL